MGMYTELNAAFALKTDTPGEVIAALKHMALGDTYTSVRLDHPLFETDRWEWMLRSGGSAYFDAKPFVNFEFMYGHRWKLTVCTNIKNYCSEWEQFLDWIGPHIDALEGEYLGTYRYEEDEDPTLLYYVGGKVHFRKPWEKESIDVHQLLRDAGVIP